MVIIRELCLVLFTATIVKCVNLQEQIDHIVRRKQESNVGLDAIPQRRFVSNPMYPKILGVPTNLEHLPRAEAIIPGRTLLLPEFGMVKSAVMFPHKELEDGAGVYGDIGRLGLKYNGRNERLLYTQFRRNNADDDEDNKKWSESSSSSSSSDEDGHMIHMMHKYKQILDNAVRQLEGRKFRGGRRYNKIPYNTRLQTKSDKTQALLNTLQKLKYVNEKKLKLADLQLSHERFYSEDNSDEVVTESPVSAEIEFGSKTHKGLHELQMTGDHFNLNLNAPEYNEVIPLIEIEKDEVTPWMFLCELQDAP